MRFSTIRYRNWPPGQSGERRAERMRLGLRTFAAAVALVLIGAANASAADYAAVARNIIPSGQWGTLPPPDDADRQAEMYDSLTPLFFNVSEADLATKFKSEALHSLGTDGPAISTENPRPGVEIVRDQFNVPHVTAATYDDGIWAAGYIAAQDRSALLAQARYNARVAAIDVPNVTALSLITDLKSFQPSEQTEGEIAKQSQVLEDAGPEGVALLHDIDTFIAGINAWLAQNSPSTAPWTRNDIFALNALKGQFLGQGGGDEARNTMFYAGLRKQLGNKRGKSVFNDLRQFKNKDMHFAVDGKANYGKIPKQPKGNVVIDPGSYDAVEAVPEDDSPAKEPRATQQASNVLMVDGQRSQTGDPLMVGGPQIGYFYPGFTYEIDMNAPGLTWRGATSVPFPGYLLIGRGEDFANTLTSASADIIDQYAEKLCGKSDTKYEYKGKCRQMETVNAGTIGGEQVTFQRTVHGPVTGYAEVKGKRVAISSKRSSYGKDTLDQLFFRRLSTGQVDSPETFKAAAKLTPQTFNSFYIDDENISMYTSGLLPKRPKDVDPGLLTDGSGKYEWEGFAGDKAHPQGTNPEDGTIVNWNETAARGFMAADDQFGRNGSAMRVDLLTKNMAQTDVGGKWDLVGLTAAMNAGATQDVRAIDTVPLLEELLGGTKAPSATAKGMYAQMVAWHDQGGSRLDGDGDGLIDAPGAASMDVAWPKIADAFMKPVLKKQQTLDELSTLFSRFDLPPGGQYSGWHQYFDRDVRRLVGEKVSQPFNNRYCGGGNLKQCRKDVWSAIDKAGKSLTQSQGTADPSAWHSDATRERIRFAPGILPTTMRYANRPSGIQQVISFNGHRP
jgi:acyl-homoserine lactone acylase PvdQ